MQKLHEALLMSGLTQRDIAHLMDISPDYYRKLIREQRNSYAAITALRKLAFSRALAVKARTYSTQAEGALYDSLATYLQELANET